MTRFLTSCTRLAAALFATAALTGGPLAHAQDAKPATKPAAKPATGAKPACAQGQACAKTAEQRRAEANVPPPTTPEQMAALPQADEDQRHAATLVHYGKYVCDEKFEVFVERNQVVSGYVDVRYKKDIWVMKPVASKTGAIRLEDMRGSVLLVQIPFKSMLLNTRTGQRIVDSCQHDTQREAELQAKADSSPQPSNLK